MNGLPTGSRAIASGTAKRAHGALVPTGSITGTEGEKFFCCVTTRRCNLGFFNVLRCRLGSLAARFLSLGMPSSHFDIFTMPSLPLRCMPATHFLLTLRILAVSLVVAPRLVFAFAAFTKAIPQTRSAPSSLTCAVSGEFSPKIGTRSANFPGFR